MIVKVTINGKEYEVNDCETILDTCLKLNIAIPHLCYLDGFSPTGVCGVCAVEVDSLGIVLSCKTKIESGMVITTNSVRLHAFRKINIERLLKHHNLNCFHCGKNGECKLQKYAFKIYDSDFDDTHPELKHKDDNVYKLTESLYYNESKCINCMKCVKFLNMACGYSLHNIRDLENITTPSDVALNILDICPTAALSLKPDVPAFLCEKIETYDVNDVFTPKVVAYRYDNQIINITPVNSYIRDKDRLEHFNLKNRENSYNDYQDIIDELSKNIYSNSHEVNIFVIGDNIDIISFSYLKILSEKFNNIKLCFNDYKTPKNVEFGINKSDMISMEVVFILGGISFIDRLRFSFYKNKFRQTLDLDIDADFNVILDDKYSKVRSMYLIVYSNIFQKHAPDFVLEKINNFKDLCTNKYGINLNIRFIPRNLSQMLISENLEYVSLDDLFSKFNKHDISSICLIGDIDYDIHVPEDTLAVSNSVFKIPGTIHIPAKHYLEDSTYYVNVFKEVIETNKVIANNLKSNREFLFDITQNIFSDLLDTVNDDVHKYIRDSFFIQEKLS